jgi:hypothetical protein
MKKVAFLFSAMLVMYACGNSSSTSAEAQPPIDLTGFQVEDIPGTGLQKAERFGEIGKVLEEGILQNGKRNGSWVVYNETKDLPAKISSFVNDVYHGPHFEYNKFGQLELMCSYSNNVLDGQFVRYGSSRKIESGYYKNGQLDGVYRKYFDKKDAVQQEIEYKQGKMHGKMRYFNEAGDVVMEYEYNNGEKVSGGIVQATATSN